ncbi:2Fe-2S iron-sulfur cluster-binding protein [Aminobacter sp. AP02]|uniref:2Fe-2S iron-sulfur cluster-binding protein n=1 Tax=Aminobacter sp. AP02 TaxID=2135737 RepID=UPI000D7B3CEE|nr:2Fe-2S iron-sulfur cluster-binding protein [Aminobacter sp. AP02]PWK66410.1 CDP-4-dehydro-6-deoxyglucose reductase/ferredoxin-NAD(P)+ reductase (naphthalene dioxygenase ferredoxin-specific) [Aminobacter sp. AP02]
MNHKVSIPQFDSIIEVRAGQSILDAALKAGLDYPYACRSGTCSACKTQVLSGRVEQRAYDAAALSEAERDAGLVLACRAHPISDCEVAPVDDEPAVPSRKTECTITYVERVTHDVVVVRALPDGGQAVQFLAGQFAVISPPGFPAREYSFASRPGSPELEFHVRARPGGNVSSYFYDRARRGDRFLLNGPFGNAYLRKDHPGPVTLVAGGTGLAPAKAILVEALAASPGRRVDLYFSVRWQRDLYFDDQFRELAATHDRFRFHPVVTDETDTPYPRDIFAVMAEHIEDFRATKIYTCGPPALVRACQDFVYSRGTSPQDCHADPFVSQESQQILNSA